nr:MAG TPA: hypothetical protein [Caudoviricetes sp.]
MIIIQAEDGAIVTDPKAIYIDKDLEGHLHIYANLSSTNQVNAVELTSDDYSKRDLDHALKYLYEDMQRWLFTNGHRHCPIRMSNVLDIYG